MFVISCWTAIPGERSYGVAIHNFQEVGEHRIKLTVGECVRILKECKNWYYGYSGKNRTILGIFPKSFIHIMDSSFRDTAYGTYVYGNQPHIVSEVTSVLREWGVIWKKLYMTHSPHFKGIERKMYELIKLRSKILSGTLPIDELKEVKRLITWHIDVGNKLLGLDMVVRDEQGNILNPDTTSVIELFRQHEMATQRILTSSLESGKLSYHIKPQSHSYTFFLSVRNLICKSTDDVELLFTLYDQRLCKPFSENFVVRWSRDMLASDSGRFFNFRALFTDLGNREILKEKVYLVCYIIRNGHMDLETSSRFSLNKNGSVDSGNTVRRPYAIACYNLYPYFSGNMETDEEEHHFLPLLPCEKDTLEGTLKRYFSLKEFPVKDSKGQGVLISFKLIQGDLKQVREEIPHLIIGNVATVRKMGFPDVILPGDVRNDLYLTLSYGEFSRGSKSSDKNIETLVTVCNEKGVPLQGGVILGGGIEPQTEYRSVVYYHDDKPRWYETFKIVVSIEEFKSCHLKFQFRHRSSKNDTKDKNDKPFAMSYVRLMQANGTTLRDEPHELLVYKIDPKKYDSTDISYLQLASNKTEMNAGLKVATSAFSLCSKDFFVIQTNVCSTKLTQNVNLLGLLNWSNEPDNIAENLGALMKVEGEEVVKFLQDVLDTLFNILTLNKDPDLYDNIVFDCLLYVISLVLDRKYFNFQPVLTLYIEESFCAPLAYNKLIIVLQQNIKCVKDMEKDQMLTMMKSLQYIMKFITRSRFRCSQLNDGRGQDAFEDLFTDLMKAIAEMMQDTTDGTLLIQAACLKYFPSTIPDILNVFNPVKLSVLLMELINSLPNTRLTKQKMMTINEIVHSPLFLKSDCRDYLLKNILILVKQLLEASEEGRFSADRRRYKSKSVAKIAKVLGASSSDLMPPDDNNVSQLELCIKILCDIMDLLFQPQSGDTINDITEIILTILRTVIQTTIRMDRESVLVANLASVMIAIFRQMTEHHFDIYISHFNTRSDLLDFLMEILLVFKDLISRPVYPTDWCEMILLQNNVILKSLKNFSHTIRDYFFEAFEHQVWNNFFHCAVSFLTQPALQLERFSQSKRWRVITRYKDMRRIAGFEIRNMWFNLGQNKKQFVPQLVSPFLEMTLVPEEELRKATIPIFFDMMQSEFYSTRSGSVEKKDCTTVKANFCEFENEMIAKLDNMVEGGSGDEQYKNLFHNIMINFCEKHTVMRDQGVKFVTTVTRLMERLLEYRCIVNDENKENRMICTVNLLDFYNEINRKEMYIRYVNKLCALHLESENYPEAAYTLRLHSKLLTWTDEPLSPFLRSLKYPQCETHRQLKEALYQDMIAYFDKGKMWECAILVCKELMRLYEEETFEYGQLSTLHRRMSQFYDYITKQLRPKPEYFRVAYYGKGFPPFLSNKIFIHRGKEYDRLSDFCSRMMNQHLNAELMNKLSPPSDEIKESPGQYMQINHVEPIMDERKRKLSDKTIHERILWYHRVNEIQKFQYSRPIRAENEDENANKFANLWLERTVLEISSPLPGILRWFPVVASETYLISPLKNAIETMQKTNKKLREMIISYKNDSSLPLNPLGLKLNGIVDAAIQGGVINYEQAFFGPNYLAKHPEDGELVTELKNLIASQIPLLDIGIQIHGQRAPPSLAPLQKHIEEQFEILKMRVEEKYGKKVSDIKYDNIKYRRRTTTGHSFSYFNSDDRDRLSQTSIGSTETPNQSKNSLISTSSFSSSIAVLAAPVLSNYNMSPQKFGTISSLSKKEKKEKKKRRNRTESKISIDGESICSKESISSDKCTVGNSQWYTVPTCGDDDSVSLNSLTSFVLASPKLDATSSETRNINSSMKSDNDKEKIPSSRPSSDSSFNQSDQMSVLSNITRDSFDSATNSEDDRVPPPLPAKNRELIDGGAANNDVVDFSNCTSPYETYNLSLQSIIDKFQPSSESSKIFEESPPAPPTPPPKKPTSRFSQSAL